MVIRHVLAVVVFLGLALLAAAQVTTVAKPKKLRVSSGVAEGLKIHDVKPKYPREAKEKGIQGDVLLQVMIDEKGHISDLKVVQGDPILAAAATDAIKKWKYKPYLLNGEPVQVETTIKIQFHL
jgi:periplasmic protein TonB